MTEPPTPPPTRTDPEAPPRIEAPREAPRHTPWGAVASGVILILFGIGWLLQTTGAIEVPWGALLPAALILVGVMTMLAARSGGVGGLITLGIVLTILTVASAGLDVPLRGGVGDRDEAPQSLAELRDRYELAIGDMDLDLTGLDLPGGTTEVHATVGMGQLVVRIPSSVPARIEAGVSMGNVAVLDREESGFRPDLLVVDDGYQDADTRLHVVIAVGMGDASVDR